MLEDVIELDSLGNPLGSDLSCGQSPEQSVRVAMVSARCFPYMGGIESHVHEISSRLAANGHQVTVLTTDVSGQLQKRETRAGVEIVRVSAWPKNSDYYFAPGIYSQILSGDFDVVHIQGYHTLTAPLGMLAAIRKRIPFVITFHSGGHSSPVRRALRRMQWAVLAPLVRRAACHIGVSNFEADFFSRQMGVPRSRFMVVPNGADMVSPAPAQSQPKEGRLIVSIGRIERYKGHHKAIEAFHKLQWRFPDARLRILGSGPYEPELRKLVKKLRLREKVLIGAIPPEDRQGLAGCLASADLVVLLSEYEAHPVAVMEALSLGRKVLTADTSGFRELAANGLVTTVPLASSPIGIAAAMAEAMESPDKAGDFTLPSWDDCAGRLQDIYETVASQARGRRKCQG